MDFTAFISLVFASMLGVIGYLIVRKETEDKEWRERMEKKVDDIPKSIMLELGNYVHVETHNLDISKVTTSIAGVKHDAADLDRRVMRVEAQLGLR